MLPHIPALRLGKPYASLDQTEVCDCRTRQPLARISQVNSGIIRKDLARVADARAALRELSCGSLLDICAKAADLFLHESLPVGFSQPGTTAGDKVLQSPREYLETLSATSGLTHPMVRRNMEKIARALVEMKTVLAGLTRGLDLGVLDRGQLTGPGGRLSFYAATQCLGLVMPSNSPAVNSLWLPAIPLKIPVVLKPGRDEPWTPMRLIQAFIAAGCPPQAFGFYPADHEGAAEILRSCGRALIFGDKNTTAQYAANPAIQVHGPGFSKILIGDDEIERWPEFIDLIVSSVAENGGRSCINASAVLVPKYGMEIAEALARKLGPVAPLPPDHPEAALAAFANPGMADAIDAAIEEGLQTPGACDITARYRGGTNPGANARKAVFQNATYLRPTIIFCESPSHPLANREFLFPYASVLQVPQGEMLKTIGPTLVLTAITRSEPFVRELMDCPLVDRLNVGPLSTMRISWDQPHEGNLFDFLYRRRAVEFA